MNWRFITKNPLDLSMGSVNSDVVREWCRVHGIEFDAVNDNLPHIQESWRINTRKIYCDLFIDDKAIHVDDFKRRWMDARMEE